MQISSNTVAALSTPYGRGAISMIRITGSDTLDIASRVFVPKNKKSIKDHPARTAIYGDIYHGGRITDDGVLTFYRAPFSYTGEDMAEICCHGGILVTRLVLDALIEAGACYAPPGEFSRRAFVAGKLSLTEAEAVMGIIDAGTEASLKLAGGQGRGVLSKKIDNMYKRLRHLLASAYAYADYPDEDMTDVTEQQTLDEINSLIDECNALIASYKTSCAVCEGVDTVIVGKPNVGKSSLLNMLTMEDTAIVTEIAGTTRDVITKTVPLGDVLLKLSDTAGIHASEDKVEKIGIDKAKERANSADLVIAVFDISSPPDRDDIALMEFISALACPSVAVLNKSDVDTGFADEYKKYYPGAILISARDGVGKKELENCVSKLFIDGDIDYDAAHITNARQYSSITEAHRSLCEARDGITSGIPRDIASLDLEIALSALSMLDGREVTEDIVNEIFSKFCVGK